MSTAMKRLFSVLFAVLLSLSAFAQAKSQHLTFVGVPIDGTLDHFVKELVAKGFITTSTRDDRTATLSGDFAGYRNCYVSISTLRSRDLVNKVQVIFPRYESWALLEKNYFKLKESLSVKYGEPADSVEGFDVQVSSDFEKLYAVSEGHCEYKSTYQTKLGDVVLRIRSSCQISLIYNDKVNTQLVEAAALADL